MAREVTRVARIELPDGTPVWARISGAEELSVPTGELSYTDTGFAERVEAGVESLHSLVTGVARSLAGPLRAVRPDEVSVQFGIELTAKAGKVVGLLADGEAKAAVTVTLTWTGDGPPDPTTAHNPDPAPPSGTPAPPSGTPASPSGAPQGPTADGPFPGDPGSGGSARRAPARGASEPRASTGGGPAPRGSWRSGDPAAGAQDPQGAPVPYTSGPGGRPPQGAPVPYTSVSDGRSPQDPPHNPPLPALPVLAPANHPDPGAFTGGPLHEGAHGSVGGGGA